MSTITINDLELNNDLDKQALSSVTGGWYYNPYWLYRPAPSYYFNPFVYRMQTSRASAGRASDRQHSNFIDYLRS